jgi:hypothetical protein
LPRYSFHDADEVLDRLNAYASDTTRAEFVDRLEELLDDPYPGDGDIFPYQDAQRPNSFTFSFGDGLVVYQVMVDYPIIYLWDLVLY